jgi:ABC-type Zn uptake system ZnuABC Zn-binding protein ZnuA
MRLSISAANRQPNKPANPLGGALVSLAVLPIAAAALAVGCGDDESTTGDSGTISVVTTLPLFADFAREIGGDRVEVNSLLPIGSDPHTWEPAPSDVQRVAEADIVFANGLDLEPAAINVIEPNIDSSAPFVLLAEKAEAAGATVAQLPEGFEEEGGEEPAGEEHGDDPHLWMDPTNTALYAGIIRDTFVQADPDGKSSYDENYESYIAAIENVISYVSDKVSEIPESNRKLVTTHDAFGYFASAYNLEVVAFVAASPGQEASPADIASLSSAMKDEGVPAVFVEPQIHSEGEILRQAGEDAGVEVCTLYSDSLDDRVTNYIELMQYNGDELARCLGG